jgi:hypothetical protein
MEEHKRYKSSDYNRTDVITQIILWIIMGLLYAAIIIYAFLFIAPVIVGTAISPIHSFLKYGSWENTSLLEYLINHGKISDTLFSEWLGLRKILFSILRNITINFISTAILVFVYFGVKILITEYSFVSSFYSGLERKARIRKNRNFLKNIGYKYSWGYWVSSTNKVVIKGIDLDEYDFDENNLNINNLEQYRNTRKDTI